MKSSNDPFALFQSWYEDACKQGFPLPDAMTLATATREGKPSARMVLYKGLVREGAHRGFLLVTNYESQKSKEMQANPHAALVFHWPALERQIRIEGRVELATPEESDRYWNTRPRESQIGAWASRQSDEIPDRRMLESRVEEFRKKFEGKPVPRPEFWGGFILVPERIEFWQGRPSRLHERTNYVRESDAWRLSLLAP